MEIGNQLRQLRLRRGITQEAMAQHFGITPQAVSKWERGAATPDISMLPELSAYFGVTIDELFALSDDTRMERIQNMIWDVRYFDPADVAKEREFLLEKGHREPENDKVFELLAEIENHLAKEHHQFAQEYAKEALRRNPDNKAAHGDFVEAMGGLHIDWRESNHRELIDYYKHFVEEHPDLWRGYMWLIDHLLDAGRIPEAKIYMERLAGADNTFRTLCYRGLISWHEGDLEAAQTYWLQMQEKFPEDCGTWFQMGEIMARRGEYEQAKAHYSKALALQPAPRYVDYHESISQLCELQGDLPGAVHALREELALLATELHITDGETVDFVKRNIVRLEKRIQEE